MRLRAEALSEEERKARQKISFQVKIVYVVDDQAYVSQEFGQASSKSLAGENGSFSWQNIVLGAGAILGQRCASGTPNPPPLKLAPGAGEPLGPRADCEAVRCAAPEGPGPRV